MMLTHPQIHIRLVGYTHRTILRIRLL